MGLSDGEDRLSIGCVVPKIFAPEKRDGRAGSAAYVCMWKNPRIQLGLASVSRSLVINPPVGNTGYLSASPTYLELARPAPKHASYLFDRARSS